MRMEFIARHGAAALPNRDDEGPIALKGIALGMLLGSACWAAIIRLVF